MKAKRKIIILILAIIVVISAIFVYFFLSHPKYAYLYNWNRNYQPITFPDDLSQEEIGFLEKLVQAARERTEHQVVYDPEYLNIAYPGGDVPDTQGVCSDVIVRSYRELGIDLQKEVHEDMADNFHLYPNLWDLDQPDTNIDHRRVPNLMTFFKRHGQTLPITDNPDDYYPGDIVTWNLGLGKTHIGIVIDEAAWNQKRYKIVHNVGAGPKIDDALFKWSITGHFRYFGPTERAF